VRRPRPVRATPDLVEVGETVVVVTAVALTGRRRSGG
jgi:hypothetical protein